MITVFPVDHYSSHRGKLVLPNSSQRKRHSGSHHDENKVRCTRTVQDYVCSEGFFFSRNTQLFSSRYHIRPVLFPESC